MPFLRAGRNRGMVTLTEYSPAKRFGTRNDPRLSVHARRSGMMGFAATTTTIAPVTATPDESRTCPEIAAKVPLALALIGASSAAATPRATTTQKQLRTGCMLPPVNFGDFIVP